MSAFTPSRSPLHSLGLDSTPSGVHSNMKTPATMGPLSNVKRKRDVEVFHTKRLNKSPINDYMDTNTSVSLKNRVRTIKKVDSIARAWINSGNELSGLDLHHTGLLLCAQRDKIILFSGVQSSTVTPVNVDAVEDFNTADALATIAIDDVSSRNYLITVDKMGNILVRSILLNNSIPNMDDGIAGCLAMEGDDER